MVSPNGSGSSHQEDLLIAFVNVCSRQVEIGGPFGIGPKNGAQISTLSLQACFLFLDRGNYSLHLRLKQQLVRSKTRKWKWK
jgi:hypothetical protein